MSRGVPSNVLAAQVPNPCCREVGPAGVPVVMVVREPKGVDVNTDDSCGTPSRSALADSRLMTWKSSAVQPPGGLLAR